MKLLKLNTKREELLSPLVKWRILGTQELGEISNYCGSDRNLQKLILRCETDGLIKTFAHSISLRKYLYLTRNAFKELSDSSYNVNEEILMHDAVVSSLLYRFSKFSFISDTQINYQDIRFNESFLSTSVDPDATLRANIDGHVYNIAVEIELNRKNSSSIFEKFRKYHEHTNYDLVIYFFRSIKTLDTYANFYNEFCKAKGINVRQKMIILCHSDKLANSTLDVMRSYWLRPDGVDSNLAELFGYDLIYRQAIDTPWTGERHVH